MAYDADEKPQGRVSDQPAEIAEVMDQGDVYFVLAAKSELIKIGYAQDGWKRLGSLQVGSPEELLMLGLIRTYLPLELERDLHERFKAHRVRGEWFKVCDEIVDYAIANCDPR